MLKILLSFFVDPDTWIGGSGLALVFAVPTIEGATLIFKFISAVIGLALLFLSVYHKCLQIKSEKKNKGTSGNG